MLDQKKNDDKDTEETLDGEVRPDVAEVDGVKSDVPALEADPDPVPDLVPQASSSEKSMSDLAPDPEDQATATDDEVTPYDDEKTDQAIDEIVAKEGDDLLAAQDATVSAPRTIKFERRGSALGRFVRSKWTRSIVLLLLLAGVGVAMTMPKSRYWILNTAGVRSSSSVVVVDSTTQLPLKGINFSLGGQTTKTGSDGKAKLTGLKLGPTQLSIGQVGYEEIKRNLVIGWGSNPLGNVGLTATGVQYVIEAHDYLSDKPIEGVEATNGQVSALSDKNGKITLSMESVATDNDEVTLSKDGYRSEKIALSSNPNAPTKTVLVPARKTVFITKQSGKYDVYKSDIDGKNRELLLPGTGYENSNISLVVSPDGSRAALVSTRDNKSDSDGFLQSSLVLLNVGSGEKVTVTESSQIQLISWVGTRLVFEQASSDGTAGDRYRVVSYDYASNSRLQLVAANSLSTVTSAQGNVYYAVDPDASDPSLQTGLFKIGADGSGKQRVFEGNLSTVLHSTYNTLSLQADDGTWYSYDISKGAKSQISAPASLANRIYVDNPSHSRSLWISQSILKSYDIASGSDTSIGTQAGITYPLQWLNDTDAVYRVSTGNETADYAVSVLGGSAHKVADVAASYGFAQAQ